MSFLRNERLRNGPLRKLTAPCVDAPLRCKLLFVRPRHVVRCGRVSALSVRPSFAAGLCGDVQIAAPSALPGGFKPEIGPTENCLSKTVDFDRPCSVVEIWGFQRIKTSVQNLRGFGTLLNARLWSVARGKAVSKKRSILGTMARHFETEWANSGSN